jgi:hypothetical protein
MRLGCHSAEQFGEAAHILATLAEVPERVSPDRARPRGRREPRFGLDTVLVAERTIDPPGDEPGQLEAWTAQEILGAGPFLGALERDAVTGGCTVPANESSTVRAGEL